MKNARLLKTAVCITVALIFSISFLSKKRFPSKRKFTHDADKRERVESRTESIDALQVLNQMAAYPNKDIAPDAYASAFQYYHDKAANRSESTFPGNWSNIGPRNIGGRTLCVAINPQDTSKVWLGSAGGGLWKSNSGGVGNNAWTYIPTGFPVNSVSSIVINPNNPNEMYIGTGETYSYGSAEYGYGLIDRPTRGTFGIGILKTTDGGATWTQSLNWTYQQNRGVWDIVMNPLRPNTLYASTTEGIYKTTDGGATWTQVLNVQMAMDMQIHKADTNIVLCGVGNMSSPNKGLYRTTNSGATWNIVTTGLPSNTNRTGRITLAAFPGNNDIMICEICNAFNTIGYFTSTDKGATWSAGSVQDIASYQGFYSRGLMFKADDQNTVITGGVEVHGSYDGGMNFIQLSDYNSGPPLYMHSDVHDIVDNPLDPNKVYIATDAGLFRSNDFGQSFQECTSGYVTTQFYIGSVSYSDSLMALGGAQDNYTNMYTGSPNWTSIIGGDGSYNAIDPTNDQIQYGSYQYLNVIQTTDQWNTTWNQIYYTSANPMGGNPEAFLAPFVVSPSNPGDIYAGLDHIEKSTNQGASFSPTGPNPLNNGAIVLSIAVSATNDDTIYCATAPDQTNSMKMYRSTDGGGTMTDISAGLPNHFPRRISVNPHNPSEVYAVFSGFGTGHIYKSVNAGGSWTNISGSLPDLPFHCITIDPAHTNVLYAGCDLGAFVSTDAGATWQTYDTGFPDAVMVYDLVISPVDQTLVCFTHGHGVWKRPLSNVTGVHNAPQNSFDVSLFPNPASDNICLTTPGLKSAGTIEIFDMNGRSVKRIISGEERTMMDVSELTAGVYLVKVSAGNLRSVKKLVIE
ncbi:MAG TPA: T9SS type A sorting domain-containing protein [Bacteroidia bacterium]|jgi:photosystem II stability/assembly factor-like uncharacterized protein